MALRCIEWFSGIGGLHFALSSLDIPGAEVVAAFDINGQANKVYEHVFKRSPITKSIEHLSIKDIEDHGANVWLMSPPCQPYTHGGKKLDDMDRRAAGLLHLTNVLQKMSHPPDFVFLENVPFFESSNSRKLLVDVLGSLSYDIEECLISPMDPVLSVPNNRKRYYLSARRKGVVANTSDDADRNLPPFPIFPRAIIGQLEDLGYRPGQFFNNKRLSDYIISTNDHVDGNAYSASGEEMPFYYVPRSFIESLKNFRFDIVTPYSECCSTFTKAYGSKHIIGVGSILQTANFELEYEPSDQSKLLELKLRFFTPLEIASLHVFPIPAPDAARQCNTGPVLDFPKEYTLLQKYRLLGNSLNVRVVAILLSRLFSHNIK